MASYQRGLHVFSVIKSEIDCVKRFRHKILYYNIKNSIQTGKIKNVGIYFTQFNQTG